uniref:Uncharacterized protein n=1 Tax=Panagrolaimus sp. JU765 TaxID=591449 RepID=A0AC34Q110_9BILA
MEKIHVFCILPLIGNWQIWTGHENGKMIVHNMSGNKIQLIYSASVNHSSPTKMNATNIKNGPEISPVKFIVGSSMNSHVWSSIEGGSTLYFWENCSVRKTLDCRKILP